MCSVQVLIMGKGAGGGGVHPFLKKYVALLFFNPLATFLVVCTPWSPTKIFSLIVCYTPIPNMVDGSGGLGRHNQNKASC